MGIRDMFDHKYPITNLHEIDLTFLHNDINTMIDILEEWETVIDELKETAEKYEEFAERLNVAEADISSLKNTVITLQGEIDAIEGTYGKDISDLKTAMATLESKMTILETKIAAVYNYIDNSINVLAKQMYQQDLIIMNKLNQAKANLQNQINDLYAIVDSIRTDLANPWHWGKQYSPDENNKLIYQDLADGCPTAEEYARLNLTADDYDAFNLTAYEYARTGFKMLHLDFVFSPIYGFKQSTSNVLTSILNWIEGTLSADGYQGLNLTADEYTALNLTAADYYSYNG